MSLRIIVAHTSTNSKHLARLQPGLPSRYVLQDVLLKATGSCPQHTSTPRALTTLTSSRDQTTAIRGHLSGRRRQGALGSSPRPVGTFSSWVCQRREDKRLANPPSQELAINLPRRSYCQQQNPQQGINPQTKSINNNEQMGMVEVQWRLDKDVASYPYVWLRDSCQCELCYLSSSKSRLLTMKNLDINAHPSHIEVDGNHLTVTWNDGHVSPFSLDWLYERRFTESGKKERKEWLSLPPQLWGSEQMQGNIPTDTFTNVLNDDKALYQWVSAMERQGIFLLTDVPSTLDGPKKLADRVAFLRRTNYGSFFKVDVKLDASNAAYTSAALGLHTDLVFYRYTPGVQVLHCVKQVPTKGGSNQFSDGFYAAQRLQQSNPEDFYQLSTLPVDFYDIGADDYKFHKIHSQPVITMNEKGEVVRINYNNQVRDYFLNLPVDKVAPLYKAMKAFDNILYDPEVVINIKLKDGEMICFHNYRVLHGRDSFQVVEGGERLLVGGYMDWDEMYSRRRVLQQELGIRPGI